jgi:signal transduction histidine kinase/CheY-like chemotaxis protein/HPt (histidine-containing phosphotransfer) domain-containing protein
MRLQQRLSLTILPAILGPLVIIGVVSYLQLQATARQKALDSMRTATEQVSASISQDFAAKTASLRFLAIASPLATYVSAENEASRYGLYQPNVLALFTDYQSAYPDNLELRLFKEDGTQDIPWSRGDALPLAAETMAAFVTELRRDPSAPLVHLLRPANRGPPVLVIGTQLTDSNSERRITKTAAVLGYLIGVFDVRGAAASASALRFGTSGRVTIADSQGRPWVEDSGAPRWGPSGFLSGLSTLAHGGSAVVESEVDGEERFVVVRSPNPELFLVASIVSSEVNRAGSRIAVIVVALTLLSVLAMHGLVYATVKRVLLTPARRLIRTAREMADGNLKAVVTTEGEDELGDLGRALRDLGDGLTQSQKDVADREAERELALQALKSERDRAEAASRAKSEFLARMSHEIRTPMNGVLGMTEILRTTKLDERQRRYAKVIHVSAESLLGIINDVLDFSKIEAGKLRLDLAPFDLRALVEDAVESFGERAAGKGLELVCDLPPTLHAGVSGDALRLRQVLVNLIGNAVKFTEKGEIRVRLRALEETATTVRLRFEVTDTGIGIKAENQQAVFDAFSQEDGSASRKYGGTGLGLAISRELIELMGGEIGVNSEPGVGSTFHFTVSLPREPATDHALKPAHLAGTCALIVDDSATNREILTTCLGSWGMKVRLAESGRQALAVLRREGADAIDVVLLDFHMPEMDGMAVVHQMRADAGLRERPVIMLSSVSSDSVRSDLKSPAIAAWLTKPVRQAQLLSCLNSVLAGQTAPVATYTQSVRALQLESAAPEYRVLLVEDNPVNEEVARAMLAALGADVTSAGNGREALATLRERRFDMVLMDCQMPEMDGYEATREWRDWEAQHPELSRMPIIALTANALQGDEQRCRDAGMDGYLSKPFTLSKLQEAIAPWQPSANGRPVRSEMPPATCAAINMQVLDTLRGLSPSTGNALVTTVLRLFLESAPIHVAQIDKALLEADGRGLSKAAHALKSSSANAGAETLSARYKQLEFLGREGRMDEAREFLAPIREEHDRAVARMREILQEAS